MSKGLPPAGIKWVSQQSQQSKLSLSCARLRCWRGKAKASAWSAVRTLLRSRLTAVGAEYSGLGTAQVKRLKELEKENARLRRAVADLNLEEIILAEAAKGNF